MIGLGQFLILEDRNLVDPVEDWSGVRSPARAVRRRKRGFPQRIVTRFVPKSDVFQIGNKLVMHPETAKMLRARIAEEPRNG